MSELEFPLKNDLSRKIIHIDMDAFFAAIEERDHPELRGKPLVIARHPHDTGGRGVVTTANYEARKYGIHSAMSAQKAFELCPGATFQPGNLPYYREVSAEIRAIFHEYTDLVEPVSVDEAYLDVTHNKVHSTSAIKVARLIQHEIWEKLQLTCSAGVSYNKFLAKLASDYQKPCGMTVITPENAQEFLKKLPIEKFHGIGKKTLPKMHELGIYTGADLLEKNEFDLIRHFGKMGYEFYRKVRGVHNAPVEPTRERKSIGREHTFARPLMNESEIIAQLRELAQQVAFSLKKHEKHGKTIVLKVRYTDYTTYTKRKTLPQDVARADDLFFYARQLLTEVLQEERGIRLLGITLTNLNPVTFENITLPLWQEKEE